MLLLLNNNFVHTRFYLPHFVLFISSITIIVSIIILIAHIDYRATYAPVNNTPPTTPPLCYTGELIGN